MGQPAFTLDVTFRTVTCYKCGVPFAAPAYFFTKREDDHESFYCPNGHGQAFLAKSEAEILRERLASEEQRRNAALSRANEAEQARAKLERKLKRVTKGVCTECNRTFRDLAEHMACKHPEDGKPKFRKRAKPPAFESG